MISNEDAFTGFMTLYEAALTKFGTDGARWALVEEMGELMTAFSHERRGRISADEVCKELVDVQMLINIISLQYRPDCGWDEYVKMADEKLRRGIE